MTGVMTLKKISWQTLLVEHCYLDMADECYFAGDYQSCSAPGMRPTILSLKRGDERTIDDVVQQLASAMPLEWINFYTFVPMPSSSGVTSHLQSMVKRLPAQDTRDLVLQICDTPSSHNGWRPTPDQRATLMRLNELEVEPRPQAVIVVDDVLATGSHFRATKKIIRQRWPHMRVIGVFLARVLSRKIASASASNPTEYNVLPPRQPHW